MDDHRIHFGRQRSFLLNALKLSWTRVEDASWSQSSGFARVSCESFCKKRPDSCRLRSSFDFVSCTLRTERDAARALRWAAALASLALKPSVWASLVHLVWLHAFQGLFQDWLLLQQGLVSLHLTAQALKCALRIRTPSCKLARKSFFKRLELASPCCFMSFTPSAKTFKRFSGSYSHTFEAWTARKRLLCFRLLPT